VLKKLRPLTGTLTTPWTTDEYGIISDRVKPKNSRKTLCHCHSVRHKSNTDSPGIEPGPPRW